MGVRHVKGLFTFLAGLLLGAATVAALTSWTTLRECSIAIAVSTLEGARCDAAVLESRLMLLQMEGERREGCLRAVQDGSTPSARGSTWEHVLDRPADRARVQVSDRNSTLDTALHPADL